MSEPSDLELIRRFGERDDAARREAFTILFERHSKRAHDLAYRVLGDSALAADAVQEAFLTVYRKGARFQARAQFTSWLHRVVLNKSIDLRRRERRHPTVSLGRRHDADGKEGAGIPEPPGDPDERPFAQALATERVEVVRQAITRLSPKLAQVVVLRYPRQLSYEEIGEILGVPPGTVKSRLNRAHAALRGILADVLGDAEREEGARGSE